MQSLVPFLLQKQTIHTKIIRYTEINYFAGCSAEDEFEFESHSLGGKVAL